MSIFDEREIISKGVYFRYPSFGDLVKARTGNDPVDQMSALFAAIVVDENNEHIYTDFRDVIAKVPAYIVSSVTNRAISASAVDKLGPLFDMPTVLLNEEE